MVWIICIFCQDFQKFSRGPLIGKSAESRVCIIDWMTNFPAESCLQCTISIWPSLCAVWGSESLGEHWWISWIVCHCAMEDIPLLRDLSPRSDPTKRLSMMENYELMGCLLSIEPPRYFYGGHSGTYRDITKSYIPTGAYHQLSTVPFIYAQSHIPRFKTKMSPTWITSTRVRSLSRFWVMITQRNRKFWPLFSQKNRNKIGEIVDFLTKRHHAEFSKIPKKRLLKNLVGPIFLWNDEWWYLV